MKKFKCSIKDCKREFWTRVPDSPCHKHRTKRTIEKKERKDKNFGSYESKEKKKK